MVIMSVVATVSVKGVQPAGHFLWRRILCVNLGSSHLGSQVLAPRFGWQICTTQERGSISSTVPAHYGPCKVFVAYKCKPARKQASLQTGCRKKGLLFVSAYKHLATITYKHLATPHRRGRFYQILLGVPKINGISA
jgi:hypothetical protein